MTNKMEKTKSLQRKPVQSCKKNHMFDKLVNFEHVCAIHLVLFIYYYYFVILFIF